MKVFITTVIFSFFSMLSLRAADTEMTGNWKSETMQVTSVKRKVTEADQQRAILRDLFVYKGTLDITSDMTMQYGQGAGTPVRFTLQGDRIIIEGQPSLRITYQLKEDRLKLVFTQPDGVIETYTFTR